MITRKPRLDFGPSLSSQFSKTDTAGRALRVLIPLSLVVAAIAVIGGWIP
jgi:hypothetical protein